MAKMGLGDSSGSRFAPVNIANLALRFLQFVFAVAVIGLYAQDLNKARKVGKYSDSKWGFAVAIGTLSAITALVLAIIPLLMSYATVALVFLWDTILFILWCAVFGLFGNMYIKENAEMDGGIKRMKNAVWIDLICMLLFFITAVLGGVAFFMGGGHKSIFTGRARV